MKSIHVEIDEQGAVVIDAKGFKGADCEKATRFIEEALGKVTKKTKKPEYNSKATVGLQARG